MFPACFAADALGGRRIPSTPFGLFFTAQWAQLCEHWHPLVTQCVIRRHPLPCLQVKPNVWFWAPALCRPQHGSRHVSKSAVHLAWFEVSVWDERWGSSLSGLKSTWSDRSPCRRSNLQSPASVPEIDRNVGNKLGVTGYMQPVKKMQMMFDKPINNSNSFSLNCLYLLFICSSRQLCSREMATNAGDRLATTGPLTGPSVSGSASAFVYFPLSAHFTPVRHFSNFICCNWQTQI